MLQSPGMKKESHSETEALESDNQSESNSASPASGLSVFLLILGVALFGAGTYAGFILSQNELTTVKKDKQAEITNRTELQEQFKQLETENTELAAIVDRLTRDVEEYGQIEQYLDALYGNHEDNFIAPAHFQPHGQDVSWSSSTATSTLENGRAVTGVLYIADGLFDNETEEIASGLFSAISFVDFYAGYFYSLGFNKVHSSSNQPIYQRVDNDRTQTVWIGNGDSDGTTDSIFISDLY